MWRHTSSVLLLAVALQPAAAYSAGLVGRAPAFRVVRTGPLVLQAGEAEVDAAKVGVEGGGAQAPLPEDASLLARAGDAADAVYRFSRPHTIRGTLLACFTGVGRALIESPSFLPMLPALLPRALIGVLALLLGNLFIVGINQIYDVGIDKVNKPFLPVAAGRLTPKAAWAIVLGSGIAALAIVKATFSPLIFGLFCFGTTIGGLYSVPPFQLKRFPVAAGLTIATCRGFLLNFGVYYATREALGLTFKWSPPVAFLARFMTLYAAVIAVTKDLGDIEGDKAGGIDTFAMRFGTGAVARGASVALLINYAHAIATALLSAPGAFRKVFMITGHALAAGWLIKSTSKLEPGEPKQTTIKGYYKQIWNLFYFEYLMYPFI